MATIRYTPHVGDRVYEARYGKKWVVLGVTSTQRAGEWLCLVGQDQRSPSGVWVKSTDLTFISRPGLV